MYANLTPILRIRTEARFSYLISFVLCSFNSEHTHVEFIQQSTNNNIIATTTTQPFVIVVNMN